MSAINNSVFVTESILDFLASDRISEFSKDSLHVINPLSVSTQSSGKRRLILDLRFANQFILTQKVKFEDYKTALDLFQYGGYACSFDLVRHVGAILGLHQFRQLSVYFYIVIVIVL